MDNRTKFLLIGLIGVAIIFGLLFFQAFTFKQQLQAERDKLLESNEELRNRTKELEESARELSNQINVLNEDLEELAKTKHELESKYELIKQERDDLVQQLQELQTRAAETTAAVTAQDETQMQQTEIEDDYWKKVLQDKKMLELKLEDIKKELASVKLKSQGLQDEKTALEFEFKNITHENEELKVQVKRSQRLIDSVSEDLIRLRKDSMNTQESLEKLKIANAALRKENKLLAQQLKKLNARKSSLAQQLKEFQDYKKGVERRLASLKSELLLQVEKGLILQMDRAEEAVLEGKRLPRKTKSVPKRESAVELPPIVVRPQSGMQMPVVSPARIEILAVNMDNNFVVINAGIASGVSVGNRFCVVRGGKSIADIEVIQVRQNIAACDIISVKSPIKVGDAVE